MVTDYLKKPLPQEEAQRLLHKHSIEHRIEYKASPITFAYGFGFGMTISTLIYFFL